MDNKSGYAYLRAVYLLQEEGKDLSTTNIAKVLEVKPASVSEMLKKLAKEKYVMYRPYKNIELTETGKKEAKKAVRRHRILEDFLVRILKVGKNEVCKQAEAMESTLSDKAEIELCRFLDRPMEDPLEHKPIPHCQMKISCERCLSGKN